MRSWLYGIARRVAANHRRTDFRRRRKQDRLASELEMAARSGRIPEAAIALEAFLAELKPADRELFVLSEIEGFTGPEIARALGSNLATTYSRIRSVRHRFTQECAEPTDAVEGHRRGRPRATAAGWAALMPQLETATTTATATTWFGANLKGLLIGMAAGGVLVTGTAVLTEPPSAAPEQTAASERRDVAPPKAGTPAEHGKVSASAIGGTEVDPSGTVPPELGGAPGDPSGAVPAGLSAAPGDPSGAVPAGLGGAARPVEQAASLPPLAAAPPPPGEALGAGSKPPAARRPTTHAEPPAPPGDAEIAATEAGELLREAKRVLKRGDSKQALALVERHAAKYPKSALADVRAVIRVKALCQLGRVGAGEDVAERYLATHPGSPMAKQLRRGCGEKKSAGGS